MRAGLLLLLWCLHFLDDSEVEAAPLYRRLGGSPNREIVFVSFVPACERSCVRPWGPHAPSVGPRGVSMGPHGPPPWVPMGSPWVHMGSPWVPAGSSWGPHAVTFVSGSASSVIRRNASTSFHTHASRTQANVCACFCRRAAFDFCTRLCQYIRSRCVASLC